MREKLSKTEGIVATAQFYVFEDIPLQTIGYCYYPISDNRRVLSDFYFIFFFFIFNLFKVDNKIEYNLSYL